MRCIQLSIYITEENGKAQKKAMRYLWSLDEETVLDPTNTEGNLELELKYLGGFYKVDTIVARINEPSKGGDCNLFTKIVGSEVQVIAERSIFPDGTKPPVFESVCCASLN